MFDHKSVVRECVAHCNYKWPKQLTSGIMFFRGERITIEEFMEQVKLLKGE